jgi:RsiW-degrading membrane proteinase PrsW (M82 family)
MSRRRDPVQRRNDGTAETDVDLHGVAEWSPRSVIDRAFAVAANPGIPIGLALLGAFILLHEIEFQGTSSGDLPLFLGFVVLSMLPALGIAGYVWYSDVTSNTPISFLALMFVVGGLFTGYAGVLGEFGRQYFLNSIIEYTEAELTILLVLVFFLITAPIEELVKVFVIKFYAFDRLEFSGVVSGALFGAVVGLGFATAENALFISQDAGISAASRRALAGPGHVIYSAIAGFYVGLARFNREHAGPLLLKGVLIAVLFHGLYNTLVTKHVLDVLGFIKDVANFSHSAALFTFTIGYIAVPLLFLIHKLSQYRNAYQDLDTTADPSSEVTEFDP